MEQAGKPRRRPARGDRDHDAPDRMWRELAGTGHTQLTAAAALRARDADQPTEDEIAEAERTVLIQHRNWTPDRNA